VDAIRVVPSLSRRHTRHTLFPINTLCASASRIVALVPSDSGDRRSVRAPICPPIKSLCLEMKPVARRYTNHVDGSERIICTGPISGPQGYPEWDTAYFLPLADYPFTLASCWWFFAVKNHRPTSVIEISGASGFGSSLAVVLRLCSYTEARSCNPYPLRVPDIGLADGALWLHGFRMGRRGKLATRTPGTVLARTLNHTIEDDWQARLDAGGNPRTARPPACAAGNSPTVHSLDCETPLPRTGSLETAPGRSRRRQISSFMNRGTDLS